MAFRVILTGGASPAEQIRDQIRGLIATDRIAAGERLPSVRQLAKDLGTAPGTVAKAYRSLEQQGLLQTRVGGGTRVSPTASTTPPAVIDHAHALARAGTDAGVSLEDTVRVLRAVWPDPREVTDDHARQQPGSTPAAT